MANKNYEAYTKDQLVDELKKLHKRKRYGLVWEEEKTKEKFEAEAEGKLPVLVEDKKREIKTDSERPTNILIEGENYHALSVLNYTHAKSIDVIYIDPPYNTGARDWKYNNDFVDEEDAFRHSKWISFMNNRLLLAKKLLKSDGIICVTIDNYEIHNLRHIMETIFTDREIVITVIEHNHRGRAKNNFALTHEYALWAIPKDKDLITRLSIKSEDIKRNLRRTGQGSRRKESPTLFYAIEVDKKTLKIVSVTKPIPFGEKFPKTKTNATEYVLPIDTNGVERRWYYGPATAVSESKKGEVWAKRIKGRIEIHYRKPGDFMRRKSVWTGPKYDSSTYGSELLTEIIGENDFPYPKSIYAVIDCIKAASNKKDAIVLDFFAGSGTTGHAVLEMNKEDQGQRQFILCSNNENNICEEITYPRIHNVIKGYKFSGKHREILFEKKLTPSIFKEFEVVKKEMEPMLSVAKQKYDTIEQKIENNTLIIYGINEIKGRKEGLSGNLKYYKTNFVGSESTHRNKKLLTDKSIEMLCIRENTYNEVLKKEDIAIFKNADKFTAILFDEMKMKEFKNEIKKLNQSISVYVFSLEGDDYKEEFEDLKNEITICSIPEAILKVYRRIYGTGQMKLKI